MKRFCFVLVAISILNSCTKDEIKNVVGPATFSSNTVLIDNNVWQNTVTNIDTLKGIFTFSSNPGLSPGDIMISESGEGFLRKVTNIEEGIDGVKIYTDFASLCDAVEDVSASTTQTLIPDLNSGQLFLEEGVKARISNTKGSANPGLGFDIDLVLYDADGNFDTEYDQVTITGSYGMTTILEAGIDIEKSDLKDLFLKYTITESANVSVNCSIILKEYKLIKDKTIAKYKFPPIILFPGCVITPILELNVGIDLTNQGNFSFQIEKSKDYVASLRYLNNSWVTDKSIEENEVNKSFTLEGTSTVEAYIKPKLLMKIDGVISPKLEAELYNQLEATLSMQGIDYEISKGFEMGVGVEMKIFKKSIFDYTANFFNIKAILSQGTIAEFLKADFIADNTTIKLGQSVKFTDRSSNVPSSWNWDFGDGTRSTEQNPTHTYLTSGIFTVTLNASNLFGNDEEIKSNYITVQPDNEVGLVAYYPFNGNANDESGNAYDGTLNGSSLIEGGGVKINGGVTSVDFPDEPFRLAQGTWEAIVNFSQINNSWIISKDNYDYRDDGMLTLDPTGKITFTIHAASNSTGYSITSNTAIQINKDYKITAQWGNGGMQLYINDILEGSNLYNGGIFSDGRPLKLGASLGDAISFTGIVRSFKVYNIKIK